MAASVLPVQCLTAQAFSVRKSDPSGKDSHYYSKANPFYAGGYTKECTWYAWGRAYEALGAKPALSTSAAHHWYQENTRTKACSYGSTPKAGAIMVTAKDKAHGHVAFVEELYSDGTMLISEYNYNVRGGFSTAVIRQLSAGSRRGRAHKVLGYIYVAKAKPADTTAPTIDAYKATKKTASGFKLSAKASDKVGVTAVKFRVQAKGQTKQEATWFDGVYSAKTDSWTCTVPVESLGAVGSPYTTVCYAYDKAGNQSTEKLTVALPDPLAKKADSTTVRRPSWLSEKTDSASLWVKDGNAAKTAAWECPAPAPAPAPDAAANGAFDFAKKSAESVLGFMARQA